MQITITISFPSHSTTYNDGGWSSAQTLLGNASRSESSIVLGTSYMQMSAKHSLNLHKNGRKYKKNHLAAWFRQNPLGKLTARPQTSRGGTGRDRERGKGERGVEGKGKDE